MIVNNITIQEKKDGMTYTINQIGQKEGIYIPKHLPDVRIIVLRHEIDNSVQMIYVNSESMTIEPVIASGWTKSSFEKSNEKINITFF